MTSTTAPRAPSVLVHTTSLMAWPGGDHTVCLAALNDGLTVRTPGLTPDQADAFAELIRDAAQRCRASAAQAAELAAAQPPAPARTARPLTPNSNRSRLF